MSEVIEVVLVDVGNTQIKSAKVIDGVIGATVFWNSIYELLDAFSLETPMMVCSTRDLKFPKRDNFKVLDYQTLSPLHLSYETPETLGSDRIAAAVGAWDVFPDQNTLIIDLGTCMTIDFISNDGVFEGGIISPGLQMRMKSMANYTSNLPDISSEWEELDLSPIGKSTRQCLLSGSYGGLLHEINNVIQEFERDLASLNVILSGGDAHFFESTIKAHIFAGSKIVQKGLYHIWKYQWKRS